MTGHTTQKQKNKLLSNEVMFPTYHTKEREARKKRQCAKRNVLLQKTSDGSQREQTHGTTGSGNYSQGMKRRQRTTLVWFSYHAVSSFTER